MDISYLYILLGSIFTLCIQALLVFILFTSFKRTIKSSKQYKNINIKKENDSKERDIMISNLRNVILDIYKSSTKESCNWFRVLIERIFIQARFSSIFKTKLKKIMLDRLKKQFERLYWIHRFIIIDIDIGEKIPKINSIRMIGLHDACQTEELELEMDISYEGGLSFTLEIFILGGLMIPIRIDLNELHGPLRLRIPSCRYQGRFDVSFIKDPGFKFSVNASIILLGESKKKSTESDRAIPLQQMLVQFLAKKLRSIAISLWVMPSWRSFSLPMMNSSDKITPSWTLRYQDHDPRSLPQIILDSPSLVNMNDSLHIKHMKSIFMNEFITYLTSTSSYYPNHPMWHLVKKSKHVRNSKQSVIALYKMPLAQKITLYRGCFVLPIPSDSVKQFIRTEQVPFVFSDQMAGTSILAEINNEIRIKECHIQLKKNQDTQTLHFLEGWYTNYKKRNNISLEWAVFYHSLSSSTPETLADPTLLEELFPESYDNKPSSPWIVFGYGVELIPESHEYVLLVMSMTLNHAQPSSLVKRFELDWNCLTQLYDQFVHLYHESVMPDPKTEQTISKSQPALSIDYQSQTLSLSDPVISRSLSFKSIKRKQSIVSTKAMVKDYLFSSLSVASKWIKSLSHTIMHSRLTLKGSLAVDNNSYTSLIANEKNDAEIRLIEPESNQHVNLLDYLSKDFCSLRTLLLSPSLDDDRIQCLLNIESSETIQDETEPLLVSLASFTLEEIQSIYHSTDQGSLAFIRSSHGFKIYKQERNNIMILISNLSLKYMKKVVEYIVDYENRLDLVTQKIKDLTKSSAIIYLPVLYNSYKYHFKDSISKNYWVLESAYNQGNDIEFTLAIDIQNDDSSFYIVIQLSSILFPANFSSSEFIQYIMAEQITYKLGFKYILDTLWRNEHGILDIQCNEIEQSNNPSEYIHHLTALDFCFPFSSISSIAFNLSWTIKSTSDIPITLSIKHHRERYDDEISILPYHTYRLHPTTSYGNFLLLVPCLIKSGPLLTLTIASQKQPSIFYILHIEPITECKLDCFAPKQLVPHTIYSINTVVSIKPKKIYTIEFPISILHSHKNNASINWKFNTDKDIIFSIYHSLSSGSLSDSDYSSKRFIIPFNLKSSVTTGSLPLYSFTSGMLCFIWKNTATFTSRQITINLALSY